MYFLICSTRKCNKSFAHGFMHMCTHDSNSKLVYARTKPIYDIHAPSCFLIYFKQRCCQKFQAGGAEEYLQAIYIRRGTMHSTPEFLLLVLGKSTWLWWYIVAAKKEHNCAWSNPMYCMSNCHLCGHQMITQPNEPPQNTTKIHSYFRQIRVLSLWGCHSQWSISKVNTPRTTWGWPQMPSISWTRSDGASRWGSGFQWLVAAQLGGEEPWRAHEKWVWNGLDPNY